MNLITLDFETYYTTKDLGFKTQTTEEYVRDPRFEVIGVAVKVTTSQHNGAVIPWMRSTFGYTNSIGTTAW